MTNIGIDANILIDVLERNTPGHRTADQWNGILELFNDIDRGRVGLVVPSILFAELLPSKHEQVVLGQIYDTLLRPNVEVIDLSVPIARRAAELRDRSITIGHKVKTVDSIYIATAELGTARVLYTTDAKLTKYGGQLGARIRIEPPKGTPRLFPF